MIVTELQLSNLRAIEAAEFKFRAGFNLIVGVNGVGKSTVLDALRMCLSRVLPKVAEVRAKPISFEPKDIRVGLPFMEATMFLDLGGMECQYSRRSGASRSQETTPRTWRHCEGRFSTPSGHGIAHEIVCARLSNRRACPTQITLLPIIRVAKAGARGLERAAGCLLRDQPFGVHRAGGWKSKTAGGESSGICRCSCRELRGTFGSLRTG